MMKKSIMAFLIGVLCVGCAFTPKDVQRRHWDYNNAIHQTGDQQLLLNIVRLRYDEMPLFLQLTSISTQFSSQRGAGVSGQITEGGPSVLGANASLSFSENPVFTWSVPDSKEYLGRLMAPLSADQLTVLAQAGWGAERVLEVGVKKINRLRNKDFRVHQGVYVPQTYDSFKEALRLIIDLQEAGLIDLAYGVKSNVAAGKIPLNQLDTTAIPDGIKVGLQFMTRDNPKVLEPLKLFKPLFLRFSKASDTVPRVKKLRALLNLEPRKYSFAIIDTASSSAEQYRSESGKLVLAFDPDSNYTEIVLNNRSMMEILYLASTLVEVPQEHLERGYVTQASGVDPKWLRVLSARSEPLNAWLKVQYHEWWFYIEANDIRSRETFTLLDAMLASVVGAVPGATPMLTLPVR